VKIELELWHLITLLLMFLGAVWAFGKVLLVQIEKRIDQRFDVQTTLLQGTTGKVEKLERDFLLWRAELPIHYVRREDYVRGQSIIESKLDALYSELKAVQLKGASHVS
jgi:hypothetical protein